MRLLPLLFLLGSGMAAATPAGALTITLKNSATPSQDYVALADIAEISGIAPSATLDALNRMQVAILPKPERELRLTRKWLTTRLRYAYPSLAGQVEWGGADAVVVSIASVSIDPLQQQTAAESALRQALSPLVESLELHVAEPIAAIAVPEGQVTINATPVNTEMLGRRMPVDLELMVDSKYQRKVTVWFDVKGKVAVAVARTDLGAGMRIDNALFERRNVELGTVSMPIPYASIAFDHARIRQPVSQGAVLSRSDVESVPAIARQQEITVQIVANGILVETSGIALSDAELGKPVRIRNPSSGGDFIAQVTAPGLAYLEVR